VFTNPAASSRKYLATALMPRSGNVALASYISALAIVGSVT
jgi:hypothetical protein